MNQDIKKDVTDMYEMVGQGKILEAFDKYYADDVTMQENEEAPRIGKEANRKYEEAFVGGITEFHGFKLLSLSVGDDVSAVESWMEVTHKDWGKMARSQVAIQHWKDGKVTSEKFYYKG